jgi:hypothetical protein
MESKGQIFGLIIIIGLLFLSTYSCVDCAEASPLTEVTLALQEDIPTVDVSPGSSGVVEMDGEVTCEKYGPDDVKVFLTGSSDFGPAPAEPASFSFTGVSGSVETRPFKVSTRVPMGTSSSITPTLTVQGYFDQGGLRTTIAPVSQIIIILQYYKIQYFIEDKEVSVESGEGVKIEFTVVNSGNGEDFFQIDFENRDELISKGFRMTEPFEVHMEEDINKSINLHIMAPEGDTGTYNGEISIISKGSLSTDSPEEVILPIHIEVTSNLGGQIGSIITSPLGIGIIAVVIVVAVYLKIKKKEKDASTSD